MTIRSTIATTMGRAVRWALHDVIHRSASQLPGRVALTLDPHLIEHLHGKATQGSVVVCGTNGKTTTTNLIAAALEESGTRVLCNRDGANMAAGVATALLPGRTADWAVIEADELSTIHVLPQLAPTYVVLLNLFRDQLDRAGEIDHVQNVIVEALAASPGTTLVTCGDDPLCMGVAKRAHTTGTRVLAFGMGEDLGLPPDRVPEARFCQYCGATLEYAFHTYAQLGAFSCPACDFARPDLAFVATNVTVGHEGVSLCVSQSDTGAARQVRAGFGGVYMAYNLLAAAAVTKLAGVSDEDFQQALDGYDPENGRLQHFLVDGREVILNLAKNPTGLNQNLSLLLADDRSKAVFVVINDDPNDGRDVSWLWDVDFERLHGQDSVTCVLAGGHRANDMQVRLKYAGLSALLANSVEEALGRLNDLPPACPLYVLSNYSALWPTKAELERLSMHAVQPETGTQVTSGTRVRQRHATKSVSRAQSSAPHRTSSDAAASRSTEPRKKERRHG